MSDDHIKKDFEALSTITDRSHDPLEHFIKAGASITNTKKDTTMFFSSLTSNRKFIIAPVATVAIAVIMFLIPVSYSQTVGWDVSLDVSGQVMTPEQIKPIATELKTALGVEGVRVELKQGGNESVARMSAYVDADNRPDPEATMAAFEKYLNAKGIKASADSTPKIKEVSSNVWAMTLDKVIKVEIEDKTDEEVEEEIRAQLEAAGIDKVEVTFERDGDDKMRIEIKAECDEEDGGCPLNEQTFEITQNGEPTQGDDKHGFIRVKKEIVDDEEVMNIEMGSKGQKANIKLVDPDDMTTEEIVKSVEKQLEEQEVDFEVKIEDGVLTIDEIPINCIELDQ